MAPRPSAPKDNLDRFLDRLDKDVAVKDLKADQQSLVMLASLRRMIRREMEKIVGFLEDLTAGQVSEAGAVNAAAQRVIDSFTERDAAYAAALQNLTDVTAQRDALQAQIDAGGTLDPTAVAAILDAQKAATDAADAIDPLPAAVTDAASA